MEERTYFAIVAIAITVIACFCLMLIIGSSIEFGAKKYQNCIVATNGNSDWCMKNL